MEKHDHAANSSTEVSWCWGLMHHQREVFSPQEQGKGSHPQSDGITEVVQVDCSRERGEDDAESRQRVCHVLSRGFWRASHLGPPALHFH